jgi:ATP phosphoribosyltransferase
VSEDPLLIALPSKGRLKEQAEAWLADCGLNVRIQGGERGYRASLEGAPGVEAPLLASSEIAAALEAGDIHLGVVGEDLLRERGAHIDERVILLRPLGFGRADLVVAAPQSWIDVETMADVDEVAMAYLARTGRRLRVATKYGVQTRAFFARHGVADYRIVESGGATEGAPAAGTAELVVDITTTGSTLRANGLRPLADGLILQSQAQLAASLGAPWTAELLARARRLVRIIEARFRALELAALSRAGQAGAAELTPSTELFDAAEAMAAAGAVVTASRPDYVFEAACPAVDALARRLGV